MFLGVRLSDIVAVIAVLVAVMSYVKARRTAARLAAMSESYWELRYQVGELRAQLARGGAEPDRSTAPPEPPPGFIPLASLKR